VVSNSGLLAGLTQGRYPLPYLQPQPITPAMPMQRRSSEDGSGTAEASRLTMSVPVLGPKIAGRPAVMAQYVPTALSAPETKWKPNTSVAV